MGTGCGCGGCGVPVTNPTARALACCGGGMRVPGWGASCLGVGRPGSGALPPRPLVLSGVRPGPIPTGCGCGGCGRGDPSPTPQRAILRAGFARCGGGMRAPGGGASLPGCGASGDGRSPTPDLSSGCSGVRPGPANTHWLWVRGVRAWGPVTNPTARALAS